MTFICTEHDLERVLAEILKGLPIDDVVRIRAMCETRLGVIGQRVDLRAVRPDSGFFNFLVHIMSDAASDPKQMRQEFRMQSGNATLNIDLRINGRRVSLQKYFEFLQGAFETSVTEQANQRQRARLERLVELIDSKLRASEEE